MVRKSDRRAENDIINAVARTRQRSLTQLVVEATYGVTETLKPAVLTSRRYDVDVADLLRSSDLVAIARHHPQPQSRPHSTTVDNFVVFFSLIAIITIFDISPISG